MPVRDSPLHKYDSEMLKSSAVINMSANAGRILFAAGGSVAGYLLGEQLADYAHAQDNLARFSIDAAAILPLCWACEKLGYRAGELIGYVINTGSEYVSTIRNKYKKFQRKNSNLKQVK